VATPDPNEPQRSRETPDEKIYRAIWREAPFAAANQNPAESGGGGPPSYPFSARLKLVHNEQAKLSATALNNVAVAFVVLGIVTPMIGLAQVRALPTEAASYVVSLGWLLTGAILHLTARLILVRLEP
jgi:hypothetical protein